MFIATQIQPWAWYIPDPADQSTGVTTANTAFIMGAELHDSIQVLALRFRFGTAGNGHYDLGIYDQWGHRLVSMVNDSGGSVATVGGTQTYTLSKPLNLPPGRYWHAFWIDNNVDQITKSNGNANNVVSQSASTSSPLPANLSSLTFANINIRPIVLCLTGAWS